MPLSTITINYRPMKYHSHLSGKFVNVFNNNNNNV